MTASQTDEEQARLRVFQSTMRTVNDIVNNSLNDLQLVRLALENEERVPSDSESLRMLDQLIHETSAKLNKLGDMQELKEKDLGGGVFMIEPPSEKKYQG
ncbi:MAG: hypothetical protein PHX38_14210 [Sulfuricella sp.]|nr:hypothetical protein [Sulfuricella sp.]